MKILCAIVAAWFMMATPAAAASSGETVTPNFDHPLPNIPGKSLKVVVVDYAPGGGSPSHSHAKSAFIYGYVVSGAIETQIEGEALRLVQAGQSFFELPGAHHVISRNASAKAPARMLAVFVVDTDDHPLTTPDE